MICVHIYHILSFVKFGGVLFSSLVLLSLILPTSEHSEDLLASV